ncbi:hypothetical protein ABT294_28410 [Nonomuraea sp. NPDC000554]|uniref:hypothetical protein n=1 Tax=Nonomuraea sp. NPDC000554 TaxID=3154259 RepID=UPI0033304BD2
MRIPFADGAEELGDEFLVEVFMGGAGHRYAVEGRWVAGGQERLFLQRRQLEVAVVSA